MPNGNHDRLRQLHSVFRFKDGALYMWSEVQVLLTHRAKRGQDRRLPSCPALYSILLFVESVQYQSLFLHTLINVPSSTLDPLSCHSQIIF